MFSFTHVAINVSLPPLHLRGEMQSILSFGSRVRSAVRFLEAFHVVLLQRHQLSTMGHVNFAAL